MAADHPLRLSSVVVGHGKYDKGGCADGGYYNWPFRCDGKEDDKDDYGGCNALHKVFFPVFFPSKPNIPECDSGSLLQIGRVS